MAAPTPSSAKKAAPIVAELGRPETPEETAARKAESSRRHRANQSMRNLGWSLGVSLLVVLFLVLVVVRPDPETVGSVDYVAAAEEARSGSDAVLVTPELPDGWSANAAEMRSSGGVTSWYIGFITPESDFIAINEGIGGANPTWVDNLLDGATPTGTKTIDGATWIEYDHREADDPGNLAYALVTSTGTETFVLNGTASDSEFAELASSVVEELSE